MDVKEKLVELPIEDALLVLREEHRQRTDSYTAYLAHGGKGDPAEEVGLDALAMAISALEKAEDHCKSYPRCYGCNAYREPTNADRIRAMSDEELDYFLHKVTYGMDECPHEYGSEKALEWLQQPAEGNKL